MVLGVFAFLVMLVGLLIYLLVAPGERSGRVIEIGRLMFACGLLALCLAAGQHMVKLF